ncbi:MAG TPA: hypothetical protein VGW10_18105, partial [Solirubrobacteraceae bacterium]|nr:hypothetical protein [Solirubrobacteraceae bacterium]
PDAGPRTSAGPQPFRTRGMVWTTLRASRTLARAGRRVTLTGRVAADPACGGPYHVIVRRRPTTRENDGHGPTGAAATSLRPGADGHWRLRVRATRTAEFAATVHPTRTCAAGTEVTARIHVTARIEAWAPSPCRRGRVVSGRVRPRQPGTRILLQRRVRGTWRTVARDRLDHHSAFGLRLPSCVGAHRIVWPKQGPISLRGVRRLRLR